MMSTNPFPWFSALGSDGTRPQSQTVPGFGEAILVFTSEERLQKYRDSHQIASPAVRFDSRDQLQSYLQSWSSVAGLLIDPESREQSLVPVTHKIALHRGR